MPHIEIGPAEGGNSLKKNLFIPWIIILLLIHAFAAAELEQTGYTKAVPAAYQAVSSQLGTVEELRYESRDYARDTELTVQKRAYVYLPYGYDPDDMETRYNIVYLMHGWGGHAGDFFGFPSTKKIIDNLIEKGDIEPTIFVSPTFSTRYSTRVFSEAMPEIRAFHLDFENHLMPAVERKYHTYAYDTNREDFAASRNHRAFGGFSLGAVTTWLEFCHDADCIRYFLPMSGACLYYGDYSNFETKRNTDLLAKIIREKDLNERGWFIYHASGTQDQFQSQSNLLANEMLLRKDTFPPENYVFFQKKGGRHDFGAVQEYLYNALPLFFRDGI